MRLKLPKCSVSSSAVENIATTLLERFSTALEVTKLCVLSLRARQKFTELLSELENGSSVLRLYSKDIRKKRGNAEE